MNNLTILFYTANRISSKILNVVIENLKTHNYPIISISQESMNLGTNIVVPKEYSIKNIYRQVLIGAKEAKTDYVALCEDDCIYSPKHFEFRPLHFGYNLNRWLLHMREGVFSYRERPILSQCIANRISLITTLEERLALKELPDEMCGEPGRLEKQLGITRYPLSTFFIEGTPNLVICHSNGILGHKRLGASASLFVEGLGYSKDWIERLL
jgi:hypothetical protein